MLIDHCEILSTGEGIEINQVFCFIACVILSLNNIATNAAVGHFCLEHILLRT